MRAPLDGKDFRNRAVARGIAPKAIDCLGGEGRELLCFQSGYCRSYVIIKCHEMP